MRPQAENKTTSSAELGAAGGDYSGPRKVRRVLPGRADARAQDPVPRARPWDCKAGLTSVSFVTPADDTAPRGESAWAAWCLT